MLLVITEWSFFVENVNGQASNFFGIWSAGIGCAEEEEEEEEGEGMTLANELIQFFQSKDSGNPSRAGMTIFPLHVAASAANVIESLREPLSR